MPRTKKTRKGRTKRRAKVNTESVTVSLERLLTQIVPDFTGRLAKAENRAERSEAELATIRGRLANLLSKDQLEAAKICGCAPEMYAIECIEIWKERIFPSFPAEVRPLSDLKLS